MLRAVALIHILVKDNPHYGSSKELFYVNDKLVLNPIELKAMDQLSIGDTKLMFVPLCSEKFHW